MILYYRAFQFWKLEATDLAADLRNAIEISSGRVNICVVKLPVQCPVIAAYTDVNILIFIVLRRFQHALAARRMLVPTRSPFALRHANLRILRPGGQYICGETEIFVAKYPPDVANITGVFLWKMVVPADTDFHRASAANILAKLPVPRHFFSVNKLRSVIVAAVMFACSAGAMAAPITAPLRIDPSEDILFSPTLDGEDHTGAWLQPADPVLFTLEDCLSRGAPACHWATVLLFPDAAAGQVEPHSQGVDLASTGMPEPSAIFTSLAGLAMMILFIGRNRNPALEPRRRMRRKIEMREMASIF